MPPPRASTPLPSRPATAERDADRLHSAAIRLLRTLRKQDDAGGISAPRLSALSVIVFGGPLTLGQLAAAEQVRPPTMTRIVTGLQQGGLVTRQKDRRDARLTLIAATAKGRRTLATGRKRRVTTLAAAIRSLGRKRSGEVPALVGLLESLVARMRE